MAIRAISTSGDDCNVGEGSIMIVAEEHAGLRVDGYIDVRPAIIIKVIGDRCDRIARPRLQDACLLADIRESPISVVVKQNVVSPETAEEVIPAVIVVIAHANACLPSSARQSRPCSDVGESTVAVVLEQV